MELVHKSPNGAVKHSKLNLVDLAGSERIDKTGAKGQTLKEAQKINLSLSSLGQCINALTKNEKHVPFRDSKLTMFLKESLGGNSKTTLLCTSSMLARHTEESVQTLRFAKRAKMIKVKASANVIRSPQEMSSLIKRLQLDIGALKNQLVTNGIKPDLKKFKVKSKDLKEDNEEEEKKTEETPSEE